jgi:hypothetical protein
MMRRAFLSKSGDLRSMLEFNVDAGTQLPRGG